MWSFSWAVIKDSTFSSAVVDLAVDEDRFLAASNTISPLLFPSSKARRWGNRYALKTGANEAFGKSNSRKQVGWSFTPMKRDRDLDSSESETNNAFVKLFHHSRLRSGQILVAESDETKARGRD